MILEHTGLPVVKPIEFAWGAMMAMHIESTAPGNLREFRHHYTNDKINVDFITKKQ